MNNDMQTRRSFLKAIGGVGAALLLGPQFFALGETKKNRKPNFIIIFVDDMGYGDVGCFGSKKNRTPHIDRMVSEGVKFTDFYVACSVCTPSRTALLTGCYPQRLNMYDDENGRCVLFPNSRKGLHPDEITIAEILREQGYKTACIGKWHLGDQPEFLPTRQGFDYYYGIPYSNDMDRDIIDEEFMPAGVPLPLMRNEEVIEAPVHQDTLTKRYTKETIAFIKEHQDSPFFVYLPHSMVHWPRHASEAFKGKSANGIYGDVVEEIDWSTGQIIKVLKELGIDDNTLVIFTSDNGADGGGSNAPLRDYKGTTYEGGMRVPCVMRFPGKIPEGGESGEVCSAMDFLPTMARLAGAQIPTDRKIDGKDIWPLMSDAPGAKSPHEAFYYYQLDQLQCVRSGRWKLHVPLKMKKRNWGEPEGKTPLKLYDLQNDIHEDNNVADEHRDVVNRLLVLAEKMRKDIGDTGMKGKNQRPAGWAKEAKPQLLKKK
ncbi:MAG: sulfatase-like hydrolase/transferase [Planctomycetota bacterium]|jgi:arylsulfatase A-like enzyme